MRMVYIPLFISILLVAGCQGAIGTLIELSRNEKIKKSAVEKQTENYKLLKTHIADGKLKKGTSKEITTKNYGHPVLTYESSDGERWVYKPALPQVFSAEKIYLYFDKKWELIDWECINGK